MDPPESSSAATNPMLSIGACRVETSHLCLAIRRTHQEKARQIALMQSVGELSSDMELSA